MARQLIHRRTPDGTQQVLERRPGPYSYSAPIDTVVFAMTAEEAETIIEETEAPPSPVLPAPPVVDPPPLGDQRVDSGVVDPGLPVADPGLPVAETAAVPPQPPLTGEI